MDEELKPCPFCGNTEDLKIFQQGDCIYVLCDNCGAEGPFALISGSAAEVAVRRWNKRAD